MMQSRASRLGVSGPLKCYPLRCRHPSLITVAQVIRIVPPLYTTLFTIARRRLVSDGAVANYTRLFDRRVEATKDMLSLAAADFGGSGFWFRREDQFHSR